MAKVMGTINQITLPAVARKQDDPSSVREAVLKAIGLMSLAAFPTLWGISAVAPELVRVLFGAKWLESVPALIILPLIVPLRMVCTVLFTTSLAMGNRSLDLRNTILNFVLLPSGFFVGAHFGLIGLCLAWLISLPLAYAFSVPSVLRLLGMRVRDLGAACGAPALAGGVMYVAVLALRPVLDGKPAMLQLIALSAAGACAYFATMALVSRRHLLVARSFIRSLVAPKTA
jgi:O-antigen/teichoic acid export membrane protein